MHLDGGFRLARDRERRRCRPAPPPLAAVVEETEPLDELVALEEPPRFLGEVGTLEQHVAEERADVAAAAVEREGGFQLAACLGIFLRRLRLQIEGAAPATFARLDLARVEERERLLAGVVEDLGGIARPGKRRPPSREPGIDLRAQLCPAVEPDAPSDETENERNGHDGQAPGPARPPHGPIARVEKAPLARRKRSGIESLRLRELRRAPERLVTEAEALPFHHRPGDAVADGALIDGIVQPAGQRRPVADQRLV